MDACLLAFTIICIHVSHSALQATFCGSNLGRERGYHFSIYDLEKIGYHLCDTLLDYCDPDQTKVAECSLFLPFLPLFIPFLSTCTLSLSLLTLPLVIAIYVTIISLITCR